VIEKNIEKQQRAIASFFSILEKASV